MERGPYTGVTGTAVGRRSFLRMGAATGGLSLLLVACGRTAPAGQTAGTVASGPTPAAAPGTATTTPVLPSYFAVQGAKPDLAASSPGLQSAYFAYPKTLVKSVSQPPGTGTDVTIVTSTNVPPPRPVDQSPAWQQINKQLNANIKLQVILNANYQAQLGTVMAGNDLPDLLFIRTDSLIAGVPEFLSRAYTDLRPYVAGDAIKEYPNLAGFPTSAWAQTVYGDTISAVPTIRSFINYALFVNQSKLDAIGAPQPTNGDEFKRILKEFTRPQANEYGIGALAPHFGLQGATGKGDCPLSAVFGAPNNWSVDANGKFTKDVETEEFKAALGFAREIYAAGYYFPDPTLNSTTMRNNFVAGRIGVVPSGWPGYGQVLWDAGLNAKPPVKFRTLRPFSYDGRKPVHHQFQGAQGKIAVKKAAPDRVKELLRILNFVAAPFGTEEYQLLNYGARGQDFEFDQGGNPILTELGNSDTILAAWQFVVVPSAVLFHGNDAEFAKQAFADQQAIEPYLVPDPSAGLFSATDASKGGQVTQVFWDGLGDMVTGRRPLTDLDQLVADWRSGGGEAIRSEYQQAYATSISK
jgi:putative aldouronate transport system substrate-binding protein